MPGVTISCPAADRFVQKLQRYLEVNKRNAGDLLKKKAKDVSMQLYKLTAEAAPSNSDIAQKVKGLGWRVKRKKGAWPLKKGEKRGSKGPLRRMQAAQIGRRQKARGAAATGWIPAVKKFGGNAPERLVQIRSPKGTVKIEGMGTASPSITIANQTPGISGMETRDKLVEKAYAAAAKDIEVYLAKKAREASETMK